MVTAAGAAGKVAAAGAAGKVASGQVSVLLSPCCIDTNAGTAPLSQCYPGAQVLCSSPTEAFTCAHLLVMLKFYFKAIQVVVVKCGEGIKTIFLNEE